MRKKKKKAAKKSTFSKYRAIGNEGIRPGRNGIARWLRELRGPVR